MKSAGNAHLARGELDAAEACYREALALAPDYAEAHNNLGLVFAGRDMTEEAAECYRHAIALDPALAQPHMNLGNACRRQGNQEAARACFLAAMSLDPMLADAYNNLGLLEQEQGRLDEAEAAFGRAISLKPNFAEAHNNLGTLMRECSRFGEAHARFRKAVELKPDFALAHNNLGTIAQDHGRLGEAYDCYREALRLDPDYAEAASNALLAGQYDPSLSSVDLYEEHRRFGERFESPLRNAWPKHPPRTKKSPLRVGFVSGDLHSHPVGYFLESVLANLDRRRIQVALYPTTWRQDDLSRRLMKNAVAWHPLAGLSDDAAARHIAEDGIDILVDLSGHTADNRLLVFAHKPAPIQVSWLYFSTTGLAAIDYLLCDRHIVPPGESAHFVERPWYLPDAYLCFTPPREDIAVGDLPAASNGFVTFGCFNNLTKLNDEVVALWSHILRNVPGSRLVLKARQLDDEGIRLATAERFARRGIAEDRLTLEASSSRTDYLASYGSIDIGLDPFPFPGGTTTVEALWMGVPVLTRRGERFISRAGESILATVGLGHWIADDDEDYAAKAARMAADHAALARLRSGLRTQVLESPLCDAPRFARNLKDAFESMWGEIR